MRRTAGGSMMRAMGRAVGAGTSGVKEALLATVAKPAARRVVTVAATSSPSSPTFAAASATGVGWRPFPYFNDGEEWETVGDEDEGSEGPFGVSDRFVFGQAPSKEEAEEAISTLHQIFVPVSFSQVIEDGCPPLDKDAVDRMAIASDSMPRSLSSESESDWIEPAMHLFNTQTFHSQEGERVLDAFRLLQTNPSIQRMVVSISTDKAVWDAVMNNEVVQEFKKSFYEAEGTKPWSSEEQPDNATRSSEEQPNIATRILGWLLDNAKAKIVGFFDMIAKLVKLFIPQETESDKDYFDVALRSSFMLSVLVFIIVAVTRIQKN